MKFACHLRDAGQPLPASVQQWVDDCQRVKQRYPKPVQAAGSPGPTNENPPAWRVFVRRQPVFAPTRGRIWGIS